MIFNQSAGSGGAGGSAIKSIQSVTASTAGSTSMPRVLTLTTEVNPQNCIYEIGGTCSDYANEDVICGWMISSVTSTTVSITNAAGSSAPAVDSVVSVTVIEFNDGIIKQNYFQYVNPLPTKTTTLSVPVSDASKSIVSALPLIRVYYGSYYPAAFRPIFSFSNSSTIQSIGKSGSAGNFNGTVNAQIVEFN